MKHWRSIIFFGCWLAMTALPAYAEPASISVYVFTGEEPEQNIRIELDGEPVDETGSLGAAYFDLAAGQYQLRLSKDGDTLLDQPLWVVDDEMLQWIVILGREEPQVYVETSHPDKDQPAVAAAPVEENLEPGILRGTLISADDGKPIANARVFVSGRAEDTRSGEDGVFELQLPPGSYSLSVLHSGFNSQTIDGVEISSNALAERSLELTPSGSELPEFVVVEPYIAGSLASVLDERRNEAAVSNILGAEQISKAGDSDAASALKRVTGLTLVDGKFIYVRGLGERYSATLLNGANVPSPDPTRRVVPLDLFPTGIIDSISVQKGYTPELPGEFGGGTVEIRTKSIPDVDFFNIDWSLGYNDQTSFKDGLTYAGGGRDWTGRDNGTRAQPDELLEALDGGGRLVEFNRFTGVGFTEEELELIGESLVSNYDANTESIDPDLGLKVSAGKSFDFPDQGVRLGFLAALDYGDKWRSIFDQVRTDFVVSTGGQLESENNFLFDLTERTVDFSGFLTIGAELGERNKVSYNWMLLRNTSDKTQVEQGFNKDADGGDVRFVELEWEEREMIANQFIGEHTIPIGAGIKLDWQFTKAEASDEIPDFRRYRYDPDTATLDDESDFIFSIRNDGNTRRWTVLEDRSDSYNVDLVIPIAAFETTDIAFGLGLANVEKARASEIRRFSFVRAGRLVTSDLRRNESLEDIITADTIDPQGWQLQESTLATDAYTAGQRQNAWYASLDVSVGDWLRVAGGLRKEESIQNVLTFDIFSPDRSPILAKLETDDRLPALTTTFFIPGDHQIRLGYAETVNRPDFTELAEVLFKDALLDRLVIGNPDLEAAAIKHYDLRWDKYFTPGEFISLGVFYKEFEKPIETVIKAGAAQVVTFQNAESAENFGAELELYKDLSFFGERWANFYVNTNYAWVDSEITIPPNSTVPLTSEQRALQGQSPYVWNFQFGYDDEARGISAGILYNEFGERILDVGVNGAPDVFEQPFRQLDLVFKKELGEHWQISAKLKNLLDDDVILSQGDEVRRTYKKGREFSIGFKWVP